MVYIQMHKTKEKTNGSSEIPGIDAMKENEQTVERRSETNH